MIAQGLTEVTDPRYLRSRAEAAQHLARLTRDAGISIIEPPGLHALYLNAGRLLSHIAAHRFPGHALACQLYLEGGIRSVELGSLYLGQEDENGAPVTTAPYELVRLALPRRTERIPGYRLVEQPSLPRHFRCKPEPVPS
ncbi:hypothetical protein ABT063_45085 [Streptomyces sp. NPDC002838]|uniref:hypothetical protein n=1 Tax=Streptomyces sp. NPDC002838 TaxID=3154436 RepID=UPI0033336BE9